MIIHLLFWKKESTFDKIISFVSGSIINHVSIIIGDTHLDFVPPGFRKKDRRKMKFRKVLFDISFQVDYLPLDYFKLLFEEKFDDSLVGLREGINCSQFVARFLRSVYILPFNFDCSFVTPGDLFTHFTQSLEFPSQ